MRRHPLTTLAIAALALLLGGCGGGRGGGHRRASVPKTLVVYASLPAQGSLAGAARQVADGIQIALSQYGSRAGGFLVAYHQLDDSPAKANGSTDAQTVADAQHASADSRTIAYIGELASGQSALSIPILNEAGIPQISPTSTAVGLTRLLPGTPTGEPGSLYPTPDRTFMRLVPNDAVEVEADVIAMREAGCTRLGYASDGTSYGTEVFSLLEAARTSDGIPVATSVRVDSPASLAPLIAALRGRAGACVAIAGTHAGALGAAANAILSALPRVRIFAPHGLCDAAWVRAAVAGSAHGATAPNGLGSDADEPIECTQVVRPVDAYTGGTALEAFIAAFRERFGPTPQGDALLGYEAMSLVMQTIKQLGSDGDSRAAVLRALLAPRPRSSVLGTFAFDRYGDTTLRAIAVYRVTAGGRLVYRGTITPPRVP